ncbi:hypothetical protein CH367_01425 [Leptospira barantonii]|uniref:Secreted protein n=1 Tax=Leptospira barantonii TaxID=2023184 RepID=A0ABX4NPH8_9LEPT|nr:hypothetical protein CH367_01425 [Leptospira barantonii]
MLWFLRILVLIFPIYRSHKNGSFGINEFSFYKDASIDVNLLFFQTLFARFLEQKWEIFRRFSVRSRLLILSCYGT